MERRSVEPSNLQRVLLDACRRLASREEGNVEDVRNTLALFASRLGRLTADDEPAVLAGRWSNVA